MKESSSELDRNHFRAWLSLLGPYENAFDHSTRPEWDSLFPKPT